MELVPPSEQVFDVQSTRISRIWPGGIPLVFLALLMAGPIYDRLTRKRMHPAYVWGGVTSFLFLILSVILGATSFWHNVANWLMRSLA